MKMDTNTVIVQITGTAHAVQLTAEALLETGTLDYLSMGTASAQGTETMTMFARILQDEPFPLS